MEAQTLIANGPILTKASSKSYSLFAVTCPNPVTVTAGGYDEDGKVQVVSYPLYG